MEFEFRQEDNGHAFFVDWVDSCISLHNETFLSKPSLTLRLMISGQLIIVPKDCKVDPVRCSGASTSPYGDTRIRRAHPASAGRISDI